jgi:hypothetical protein
MFPMTSPHQIHSFLYRAEKEMADPGDAGIIRVSEDLQICQMVSDDAETRTLARPTKVGIQFVLRLMTDGGTVTVTVTGGVNVGGNTVATFADASDLLSLISVEDPVGTFRWEVGEGNVGVTLA